MATNRVKLHLHLQQGILEEAGTTDLVCVPCWWKGVATVRINAFVKVTELWLQREWSSTAGPAFDEVQMRSSI